MATSLHQQLKQSYAERFAGVTEAPLGRYRIDVRAGNRLIEVQQASLSALRDKTRQLLRRHDVIIVKPIIRRRLLVKMDKLGGAIVGQRLSPKRGIWWHAFRELIYFRKLFPHPRLTIDLLLVDIEELRVARPKTRFRGKDYEVLDRVLTENVETRSLQLLSDLGSLLPAPLPDRFDTAELAEAWSIPRHETQRIVYFLREVGLIAAAGKLGRSMQYVPVIEPTAKRRRAKKRAG